MKIKLCRIKNKQDDPVLTEYDSFREDFGNGELISDFLIASALMKVFSLDLEPQNSDVLAKEL